MSEQDPGFDGSLQTAWDRLLRLKPVLLLLLGSFVGSVKWLNTPVDSHDLATLRESAPQVPGFDQQTGLVVATRSGVDPRADVSDIDVVWGPRT